MNKTQVNFHISAAGKKLLAKLAKKASKRSVSLTGRRTSQAEIIETALRLLAFPPTGQEVK